MRVCKVRLGYSESIQGCVSECVCVYECVSGCVCGCVSTPLCVCVYVKFVVVSITECFPIGPKCVSKCVSIHPSV